MFDCIVITAANAEQAKGYRAQIQALVGVLAPQIVVVPDPGGRRVGSLGSTVNVLRRTLATVAPTARVLICHSGGDSKRLPAYAAMGKAFVPMPDGRSLFEHIVDLMDRLPAHPGVTVCCGDVIPRLDPSTVVFAPTGVTGVAYTDGPWQARRHGVYQVAAAACGCAVPVTGFLQKPQVTRGRYLIDTGILFFDWATAQRMRTLPIAGDIYEQFPRLLLGGFASFQVSVVPSCEFFHVGSSRELLKLLGTKRRFVEGCAAPIVSLAGDNIVTHVPASYGPVTLARGECLTCLPIGPREWKELRYRIDDDFKSDGKWEQLQLGALMKQVNQRRLLRLRAQCRAANEVVVDYPLRVDLAGGWSDTPPICNEQGGAVLNCAVLLEDKKPVRVVAKRLTARVVRVTSLDLQQQGELTSLRAIQAPKDPSDWCALVKSALTVIGFDFTHGGVDLTISANVPKGSGLGTSSILGAAVIEALVRLQTGRVPAWREVSRLTLALEQEMRTGGGWQDQMGALLPGVKLVSSRPGAEQVLRVQRVPPAAVKAFQAFLAARGVLFFTGQKRLAYNVLAGVLDFYARNPEGRAQKIVAALKDGAARAFAAVRAGDFATFAACLNEYWELKKALDPGSTNAGVEAIFEAVKSEIVAGSLCGAGGGGFMILIAKSSAARTRIEEILKSVPGGKVYPFVSV